MADLSSMKPNPGAIGGVPKPPFARLPVAGTLFAARAARFRALAALGDLAPYLRFLSGIAEAQAFVEASLPEPPTAGEEALVLARTHAMPPLDRNAFEPDVSFEALAQRFFEAAERIEQPAEARAALDRVASVRSARDEAARNILDGVTPGSGLAEHAFAAAALQLHFARLASRLDANRLVPVGTGVCPACGGPPVSSIIVGWIGAEGARYCSCALCGTLWNVVRITCTLCGSTAGISYAEVDGSNATIKAETCDPCGHYVKILQGTKDHLLEPVADDVASLGLDLLLRDGGRYKRGGYNPFLLGY